MTSEIIERVARRRFEAAYPRGGDVWETIGQNKRQMWINDTEDFSECLLDEIREPIAAVIRAGDRVFSGGLAQNWRAMIDALKREIAGGH